MLQTPGHGLWLNVFFEEIWVLLPFFLVFLRVASLFLGRRQILFLGLRLLKKNTRLDLFF